MNNRNLNLNTLLPKLATIVPFLAIALNLVLHVIRTGSLVSFDWQWTVVGLLASGYFGIFCKDLTKNNQNYK
ncbi:bacteriocin immunity protein [Streptococcus oralis]|nr:bacteriocin immunity protein [Streptococcus oralis]